MDYRKKFFNKFSDASLALNETEISLATYIKENYKKISFLDMLDVSKLLAINPEHITTYSNKLGFKDYEDLRKSIRDFAMSELSTTDRFEFSLININPKINNVKNIVINNEVTNLNKLLESFNDSIFYSILEEIIKAPEIIVVGTRTSGIIAKYATEMFNRLGKKTSSITSGSTDHFNKFPMYSESALVLAIGFARYPKETIRIVSFFKKNNFKVISITDNAISPLTSLSDIIFTIPCESVSITDSYTTPISVLNIIIILLSQIDKEGSVRYLKKFEEIAKDYGFYF